MKAAVLGKYGVIKWCEVDRPVVADGDVLVKVDYASICGSDQHIFKGEFTETISHLEKDNLKPDAMISCQMDASEAQKAFELLENAPANYLKILLKVGR